VWARSTGGAGARRLFDFTSFGKLDVSGPGALAPAPATGDNDVNRPVGSVVYTQFLIRAGDRGDPDVTRWAHEALPRHTGSNFVASDLGWIRMHLPEDGTCGRARTSPTNSRASACGARRRDAVLEAVTSKRRVQRAFPYMSARQIDIAGVRVWASE